VVALLLKGLFKGSGVLLKGGEVAEIPLMSGVYPVFFNPFIIGGNQLLLKG